MIKWKYIVKGITMKDIEEIKNEYYDEHINSFMDDDDFEDHVYEIFKKLNNLEEEITLHRVVFLKNIKNLNINDLGIHWVEDIDIIDDNDFQEYLQHECSGDTIKGTPFKIEATFNKSDINIDMNISQFLYNPKEEEITLKRNAKPISKIKIYDCEKEKFVSKEHNKNKKRIKPR